MKKIFAIFILVLYSCANTPKDYNADNIIPQDKMTKIIVDFYLAEAAIMTYMQDGNYAREYSQYFYENLFLKYQITREDFLNSLRYYCFDIKKFSEIINAATLELNKIQNTTESKFTHK